jgi:hypothetical protein
MSPQSTRFIFIIGMHRSGTSCLAGALEISGLFLGKVSRSNRDNARGNHENMNVRRINDRILAHNGGKWNNPPNCIQVTEEQRNLIREHLCRFSSEELAGIKDPRMVLCANAWLSEVSSFQFVATFRHPMAVAISLEKRNSIRIEEGLRLWIHYNERLLGLHTIYNFPVVEYDLSNYEEYCESVARFAAWIGLTTNTQAIRQFVSSELMNVRPPPDEIPAQCRELYFILKRIRFST